MEVRVAEGWEAVGALGLTVASSETSAAYSLAHAVISRAREGPDGAPLCVDLIATSSSEFLSASLVSNAKFVEVYSSADAEHFEYACTVKGASVQTSKDSFLATTQRIAIKCKCLRLKFLSLKGNSSVLSLAQLELETAVEIVAKDARSNADSKPLLSASPSSNLMQEAAMEALSSFKSDIISYIDLKFSSIEKRVVKLEESVAKSLSKEEDALSIVAVDVTSRDLTGLKSDMALLLKQLKSSDGF